jgi:hypothetical protein
MFVAGAAAAVTGGDPVKERGLRHSTQGRVIAESAIARVNSILTGSGRSLAPAWKIATSSGKDGGENATPVYLIAAKEGASSTPAAVPRGCTCIFINMKMLKRWVAVHAAGAGKMDLDTVNLLAFMLLHEVGHIAARSAGVEFVNGETSQLNIDPSIAKANEEKADQFAVLLIRSRMDQKPVSSVSLAATTVSTELGKLSWNMQAYRTLEEFGAVITGKPAVFFDQNYSHPNLAWRVLNANHLIHRTAETKALLDAFQAARRKGANP